MNRWSIVLTSVALCACAATTSGPEIESTAIPELSWEQVDRADGATLYGNLCASCHGPTGRGDGPMAGVLTVAVPDLTGLSRAHGGRFPLRLVENSIRGTGRPALHGGGQMPLWGPALEGVFDDLPRVNQEAFAANRVRRIARHLESLQVNGG